MSGNSAIVAAKYPGGHVGWFMVDASDEAFVRANGPWYMTAKGYPYTPTACGRRFQWLAVMLMGRQPGKVVDHANRVPSDNRRGNLRHITQSGNAANVAVRRHSKSGIKGVAYHSRSGTWRARIQVSGEQVVLGYFKEQCDAAATFIVAHHYYHEELYPGFRQLLRLLFGSEEMDWSNRAARRVRDTAGRYAERVYV